MQRIEIQTKGINHGALDKCGDPLKPSAVRSPINPRNPVGKKTVRNSATVGPILGKAFHGARLVP